MRTLSVDFFFLLDSSVAIFYAIKFMVKFNMG